MIAIDPGVHKSGWAIFEDGMLTAAGHDENDLVRVWAFGKTVVMVTHDAAAANRAKRKLHLRDGHIDTGARRTTAAAA